MKRILVVDDEEILRMLICDTLEDLGFSLEEAETGDEALRKITTNVYDLVILDFMMPNMTGIEVIEKIPPSIKEVLPVLMLTAKAQEADRVAVLEKGADYFMSKPFSPVELAKVVEDILHG